MKIRKRVVVFEIQENKKFIPFIYLLSTFLGIMGYIILGVLIYDIVIDNKDSIINQ